MLPVMMRREEQLALLGALQTLPANGIVVEFGSGGSSVLLADHLRFNQTLYSIEHHPTWFNKVSAAISRRPNVHLLLCPRTMKTEASTDIYDAASSNARAEVSFSRWLLEESTAPAGDYLKVDDFGVEWPRVGLVVVDGLYRGAVLALLRMKLHRECIVAVHDAEAYGQEESRRAWYGWSMKLYEEMGVVGSMVFLRVPQLSH